jgi:beta-glucosidase-like glycosyl hydrolase
MEHVNLPPFQAAVKQGVSAVMTSHALYPALDPVCPATVSRPILTGLLRKQLDFQGLIITDDLEMGAIDNAMGPAAGSVAAFEAGADILLISRDQGAVLEGMGLLRQKLLRGEIPASRLVQSEGNIVEAKTGIRKKMKETSLEEVRTYFAL